MALNEPLCCVHCCPGCFLYKLGVQDLCCDRGMGSGVADAVDKGRAHNPEVNALKPFSASTLPFLPLWASNSLSVFVSLSSPSPFPLSLSKFSQYFGIFCFCPVTHGDDLLSCYRKDLGFWWPASSSTECQSVSMGLGSRYLVRLFCLCLARSKYGDTWELGPSLPCRCWCSSVK